MLEISELNPARLRDELSLQGRSQAALARHLGLDASAVSRIVKGTRQMKASEAQAIIEYLQSTESQQISRLHASPRDFSPGAMNVILSLTVGQQGSLEGIVTTNYVLVFRNLQTALERYFNNIPEGSVKISEEFWYETIRNPFALVLMAQGAAIIPPHYARFLNILIRIVELSSDAGDPLEANPEAIRLAKQIARVPEDESVDLVELRSKIASQLTAIAMVAINQDDEIYAELDKWKSNLKAAATNNKP